MTIYVLIILNYFIRKHMNLVQKAPTKLKILTTKYYQNNLHGVIFIQKIMLMDFQSTILFFLFTMLKLKPQILSHTVQKDTFRCVKLFITYLHLKPFCYNFSTCLWLIEKEDDLSHKC